MPLVLPRLSRVLADVKSAMVCMAHGDAWMGCLGLRRPSRAA